MPRRVGSMVVAERPTLIYDGECGLCRDAVRLLQRWDPGGRSDCVRFQDAAAARFGSGLPALAAAMHLFLPDGRVFAGADASLDLSKLLPGKAWLAPFYGVTGVRAVA